MLGKLIKHEYKQTATTMLPLFGALLILIGLTKISMLFSGTGILQKVPTTAFNRVLVFVSDFLFGITVFALVAAVVSIILLNISRFYRNTLGDEGYLMFTLPVTAQQHIFAKLLVAFTWTLGGIAVCVGSLWLFTGSYFSDTFIAFSESLQMIVAQFGNGIYVLFALLPLLFLLGVCMMYQQFYTAISIGGQWPQNRLVASIGAYVCINVALQFIMLGGIAVTGLLMVNTITFARFEQMMNANPISVMNIVFCILAVILAVLNVLYFFVTRWLLSKKLNLA